MAGGKTTFRTWVVCAPGLEAVLRGELKRLLGFSRRKFLTPLLTGKHGVHKAADTRATRAAGANTHAAATDAVPGGANAARGGGGGSSTSSSTSSSRAENRSAAASRGGAECWLTPEALVQVHTCSAVAESVRVRVGSPFRAKYWNELVKGLDRVPLAAFLGHRDGVRHGGDGGPVEIRVVAHKSRLLHTGAIEQRVRKVLDEKLGPGSNPDHPQHPPHDDDHGDGDAAAATAADAGQQQQEETKRAEETKQHKQKKRLEEKKKKKKKRRARGGAAAKQPAPAATVYVHLLRDHCQVSVDASGVGDRLLHNRGYRRHIGKAPLRETLAAACWQAARDDLEWQQQQREQQLTDGAGTDSPPPQLHVWDPFCGSGTMLFEAFLHEHNLAAAATAVADDDGGSSKNTTHTSSREGNAAVGPTFPPGMNRLLEAAGDVGGGGGGGGGSEDGGSVGMASYPFQLWPANTPQVRLPRLLLPGRSRSDGGGDDQVAGVQEGEQPQEEGEGDAEDAGAAGGHRGGQGQGLLLETQQPQQPQEQLAALFLAPDRPLPYRFSGSDLERREVRAARANVAGLRQLALNFLGAIVGAAGGGSGSNGHGDTGGAGATPLERDVKRYFRRCFDFFEADCADGVAALAARGGGDGGSGGGGGGGTEDQAPLVVLTNLPYGQRSGLHREAFRKLCADLRLPPATESSSSSPPLVQGMYVVTPLSPGQMQHFAGTGTEWRPLLRFRTGGIGVNLLGATLPPPAAAADAAATAPAPASARAS